MEIKKNEINKILLDYQNVKVTYGDFEFNHDCVEETFGNIILTNSFVNNMYFFQFSSAKFQKLRH